MLRPYVIKSPPFDPSSGGIRVLYGLYGWLLAKGQTVALNQHLPGAVAIYPEIYHGNDLGGATVIRYVLAPAGRFRIGGVHGPGPDEIRATSDDVYVFSRIHDNVGVPDDHILFLPVIPLNCFTNRGRLRTKTCYCYRTERDNLRKHPDDSVLITRKMAQDQAALAELLNQCYTFYCYDRVTALMEVARLCGCPVQYWGSATPAELSRYEPGTNGIGYRQAAALDAGAFRDHYLGLRETFSRQLDDFLRATQ